MNALQNANCRECCGGCQVQDVVQIFSVRSITDLLFALFQNQHFQSIQQCVQHACFILLYTGSLQCLSGPIPLLKLAPIRLYASYLDDVVFAAHVYPYLEPLIEVPRGMPFSCTCLLNHHAESCIALYVKEGINVSGKSSVNMIASIWIWQILFLGALSSWWRILLFHPYNCLHMMIYLVRCPAPNGMILIHFLSI